MDKILYAILKMTPEFPPETTLLEGKEGVSGSELYLVKLKDIAAVVSDFTLNGKSPDKALALDYAAVIEKISKKATLLPMRFGTFLRSDETISQLLTLHYDEFFRQLLNVENKDEYGLKVMWDFEKEREKIKVKSEKEEISVGNYFAKQTVNTNYLFEKIKQHRMEDAILQEVENLISEISGSLVQINPECKFKKMVTAQIILDGVFLVKRAGKEKFISAIEKIRTRHEELHFLLTGPWPPYSFAGINIE